MYDAVCLSLADHLDTIKDLRKEQFIEKIEILKHDEDFRKHAGAASSAATNIREKVRIANEILYEHREV